MCVGVGVSVTVGVGVAVDVEVGVSVSVGVGVAVDVGVGVSVSVGVGVVVSVGVGVCVGGKLYSTWSNGALAESPSYEKAVRCPLPVMRITSELPLAQPGRLTISCMMKTIFGVRCLRLASPIVDQAAGLHPAAAVVLSLEEIFPCELLKADGLSLAWPWMVREVVSDCTSSVVYWI